MVVVEANGAAIPVIGLGTWQLRGETAVRCVKAALDCGYRHIDTATLYENEAEIGRAIATHIIPRSEVFITTKVWPSDLARGRFRASVEGSLRRLSMDHVDLLLIHWPTDDVPLEEQIEGLVESKRRGLAQHIGVANFPVQMLEAAIRLSPEPLVTNQVEHHPYLDQAKLLAACRANGLAMTSYSPLGRGAPLRDPIVTEIARARGRTPAQIILRWHVQQPGNSAIPRSSNPERIRQNIDIFDFELEAEEMAKLRKLARRGGRLLAPFFGPDWDE